MGWKERALLSQHCSQVGLKGSWLADKIPCLTLSILCYMLFDCLQVAGLLWKNNRSKNKVTDVEAILFLSLLQSCSSLLQINCFSPLDGPYISPGASDTYQCLAPQPENLICSSWAWGNFFFFFFFKLQEWCKPELRATGLDAALKSREMIRTLNKHRESIP